MVLPNKITRTATLLLLAIGLLLQAPHLHAQSARPGVKAPSAAQLDLLYQQALAAFAQQDWMQALIKFERVQLQQPNYRDTGKLLAQSRANLLKQTPSSPASAVNNSAIVIVVVGVSLLGLISWLPANRARLYRLFGNYSRAAMIYERLVFGKPSRTKLYAPLAEAYLRLNRRDATAMRIYKRVLELNLAASLRAELHNIVTGYNLDEMQTKWHVNEVLDSRLEKKLAKRAEAPRPLKPSPAEKPKTPRRPRKPAGKETFFADHGYAGGLFVNGKLQIEKY